MKNEFKVPPAFIDVILNLFIFSLAVIVLLPEGNNIKTKIVDTSKITVSNTANLSSLYELVVFNTNNKITIIDNKGKKQFSGDCIQGVEWLRKHAIGPIYIDILRIPQINSKCLSQIISLDRFIYFVQH